MDSWEITKIAFSIISIGSGLWLTLRGINGVKNVNQMKELCSNCQKCHLNKRSLRKQKDLTKQKPTDFIGRPVSIQNVTAHFPVNNPPHVFFESGKNDDFAKVDCLPFYVVQKASNKLQYEHYQVNVKDTLVSQNVLMRENGLYDPSKNDTSRHSIHFILTSASTLGILGTLTVSSDSSDFVIDAKIIGVSIKEIQNYLNLEMFYKRFQAMIGGVIIILGVGMGIKLYQDFKKKRVPLEASLLDGLAMKF